MAPTIRISIITEFISETDNSTGYFWSKIIKKLENEKLLIQIIAPNNDDTGVHPLINSVHYRQFTRPKFDKDRLLSRLIGHFIITCKFVYYVSKYIRKDQLVLSGTNPAAMLCAMPVLKSLIGFKWVLLVHDIYPDNLVPARILRKETFIFNILCYFFKFAYSSPDQLIVIGRDMMKLMREKTGNCARISFIPNWVCSKDIYPLSKSEVNIFEDLDLNAHTVFQFFGNMGRLQGIDNLLAVISKVKNKKAAFLFIGDGSEKWKVKKFIKENKNIKIIYHEKLDSIHRNKGLAACDVAIVSLEKDMLGLAVPSKAYFSMAADRFIFAIMDEKSEIGMMINDHNIGWITSPGNVEYAARKIDEICDNIQHINKVSPRHIFEKFYNEDILLSSFIKQIKEYI